MGQRESARLPCLVTSDHPDGIRVSQSSRRPPQKQQEKAQDIPGNAELKRHPEKDSFNCKRGNGCQCADHADRLPREPATRMSARGEIRPPQILGEPPPQVDAGNDCVHGIGGECEIPKRERSIGSRSKELCYPYQQHSSCDEASEAKVHEARRDKTVEHTQFAVETRTCVCSDADNCITTLLFA